VSTPVPLRDANASRRLTVHCACAGTRHSVPQLAAEKVEGMDEEEEEEEGSGRDQGAAEAKAAERKKVVGVLRPGWTVQRSSSGQPFFLQLHTGATARCVCSWLHTDHTAVCAVHVTPESWRFTDTESKWHLSAELWHHGSAWFKRGTVPRVPVPRGEQKQAGKKLTAVAAAVRFLRGAGSSLGDAKSLRDAYISPGDAESLLGDAKSSLGDANSELAG
jgi:hypothetical protein